MIRTVLSLLLLGAWLSVPGVADSGSGNSPSVTISPASSVASPAASDKRKASAAANCKPAAVRRQNPARKAVRKRTSSASASAQKNVAALKPANASALLPVASAPLPASILSPAAIVLPTKATVEPRIASVPLDSYVVTDVHLRPLFTTTIRLPESATSIAVGAPTMFLAEHSDDDPRLVFVKPSTHEPAESNLLIALQSGETISMKLISPGDAGSRDNVDFVLDYRSGKRLLLFAEEMGMLPAKATSPGGASSKLLVSPSRISPAPAAQEERISVTGMDGALFRQAAIAAPRWSTAEDLTKLNRLNEKAPRTLAVSLGQVVQEGDSMLVSYSILNIGNQWVQILPPQIQLADPTQKKSKKKRGALAEQVPIQDYRLNVAKLSPGSRTDGVVKFSRPGFKQSRESLLLQLATASAVDTPILIPIPFVAPGS